MTTTLPPHQIFAQDCTAVLLDPTLAPWEKVQRIALLAAQTIAQPTCLRLSCHEEAVYCPAHADERCPAYCKACGAEIWRVLYADCHEEEKP